MLPAIKPSASAAAWWCALRGFRMEKNRILAPDSRDVIRGMISLSPDSCIFPYKERTNIFEMSVFLWLTIMFACSTIWLHLLLFLAKTPIYLGLPWWLSGKESIYQCRRCKFYPWVEKIPWRRKWLPTPVFLLGESHGQRSLAGYSPWGYKESDTS